MMRMSFGAPARSCPQRARKLEMAQRRKQVRRPLELSLDQHLEVFDPNTEAEVAITAKPRPHLWEMNTNG